MIQSQPTESLTLPSAPTAAPAELRFSVLGPVRIWHGPTEVDVGPKQQRSLLALLLARPEQPISVQTLVDLLWEERPPASAVNLVHKYVGALRRLFEPDLTARSSGRWLIRHGSGYRLAVDHASVDLLAFRRLVEQAQVALAENRADDGLAVLLQSLSLWRGPFADGLDLGLNARAVFTAIDQEYFTTLIEAAEIALDRGQHSQILPLLRDAARRDLLNESLQARFMLSLAAAGQQAVALDRYEMIRNHLTDELGIDPGPELRLAHQNVLRQLASASSPPSEHADLSGDGVEEAASELLSVDAGPAEVVPLVQPAQLPADLPTFAGRHGELTRVSHLLAPDHALPETVVITAIDGMAGIGKTTLAVHWAHQIADRYPDGQLYLNLHGFDASGGITSTTGALHSLLHSLGVPAPQIPDGLDGQIGMYRSLLSRKRVLVLLDNARDIDQVRPLLPGGRGNLVIVTSRNPLAGLVATDGAHLLTLDLPTFDAARETLAQRLGATRVSGEPTAVDEIVNLCGRLPLALAIVAARAAAHPDFSLADIAADLRQAQGSLDAFDTAGGAADARTVFSWSYHLLSPDAARLFRLLSLQSGADITAAACASMLGLSVQQTRLLIAELRDTALLTEQRPARYLIHDLICAYAAELSEAIDPVDERAEALARLLQHYLHSAHAAQVELRPHRAAIPPGPAPAGVTPETPRDYQEAMTWFGAERQTLNAAVKVAAESDHHALAWQLALSMQQFYQWQGFFHDWLNTMQTALAAAEAIDDLAAQGHVLRSLAGAYYHLEQSDQTLRHLERAREMYERVGFTTEHAYVHTSFGDVYHSTGRLELALHHRRQALELYLAADVPRGVARGTADLALSLTSLGRHEEAIAALLKASALAHEHDYAHQQGQVLLDLGSVFAVQGRHEQAVTYLQRALDISRQIGHRPLEADILLALGDSWRARGDAAAARDAWEQAYALFDTLYIGKAEEVEQRLDAIAELPGTTLTATGTLARRA